MESVLGAVFVTSTHRPLSANAIRDILYPDEKGEGPGKRVWISTATAAAMAQNSTATAAAENGTAEMTLSVASGRQMPIPNAD